MIWIVLAGSLLVVLYTFYWATNLLMLQEKPPQQKDGWDVGNTLLVVEHPINKYMVSYKTNKDEHDEHKRRSSSGN